MPHKFDSVSVDKVARVVPIDKDHTGDLERVLVRVAQLNIDDPEKWMIITRQSRRSVLHGWSHMSQVSFPIDKAVAVDRALADMFHYYVQNEHGDNGLFVDPFFGPHEVIE